MYKVSCNLRQLHNKYDGKSGLFLLYSYRKWRECKGRASEVKVQEMTPGLDNPELHQTAIIGIISNVFNPFFFLDHVKLLSGFMCFPVGIHSAQKCGSRRQLYLCADLG